ncbi:MAG: hypothetical protein ACRD3Y_07725, partial [Bryobacteraceae bacterium]
YYFRPKAAFRVVWKAVVNRDVPRLYVEAKSFLKLRAQRNRMVKLARSQQAKPVKPIKPVEPVDPSAPVSADA